MFWSNYINPRVDTFGNAYKSALVAGYTDESARNVTRKDWFKHGESYYSELLHKAEEVLLEDLDMDIWEEVIYRGKKTGEKRINPNLARIRSEMARFVLLTIGRHKYHYYKKNEREDTLSPLVQGNEAMDRLFRKRNLLK
jgi:hypothetical protein